MFEKYFVKTKQKNVSFPKKIWFYNQNFSPDFTHRWKNSFVSRFFLHTYYTKNSPVNLIFWRFVENESGRKKNNSI